jgi:hypothetical protein
MNNNERNQWKELVDFFFERTNLHCKLVNKYAGLIYARFDDVTAELVTNAYNHDESKYHEPEYTPYIYLTWGKKNNMDFDGLMESMPQICKMHNFTTSKDIRDAINSATWHHVTQNKHHPESHSPIPLDNNDRTAASHKIVIATSMDPISIAEMCADWAAMSEELGTDLLSWAHENIGVRWRFFPYQIRHIEDFLNICVENG